MSNNCPCCGGVMYSKCPVFVDLDANTLTYDGRVIKLPAREAELASVLVDKMPAVASSELIYMRLWPLNEEIADPRNNVAIHVMRLRRKLDGTGLAIKTVWGSGFQFVMEPTQMLQAAE